MSGITLSCRRTPNRRETWRIGALVGQCRKVLRRVGIKQAEVRPLDRPAVVQAMTGDRPHCGFEAEIQVGGGQNGLPPGIEIPRSPVDRHCNSYVPGTGLRIPVNAWAWGTAGSDAIGLVPILVKREVAVLRQIGRARDRLRGRRRILCAGPLVAWATRPKNRIPRITLVFIDTNSPSRQSGSQPRPVPRSVPNGAFVPTSAGRTCRRQRLPSLTGPSVRAAMARPVIPPMADPKTSFARGY